MTAMALNGQETRGGGGGSGLVLLLAVGLILAAIVFTTHSRISHSDQVPAISKCFKGDGTVSQWYVGPDGRYSRFCNNGNNNYWRIFECVGKDLFVITQFKQKARRLARYLINKGYATSGPPPCL